jgi:hypothetical protein
MFINLNDPPNNIKINEEVEEGDKNRYELDISDTGILYVSAGSPDTGRVEYYWKIKPLTDLNFGPVTPYNPDDNTGNAIIGEEYIPVGKEESFNKDKDYWFYN